MNEAGFWRRVRDAVNGGRPRHRIVKLTDAFVAGTPDALYCVTGTTGVLELKYAPAWPVRATTEVPVGSGLTVEQRRFLEDWRAAEGRAHVLLGVAQEWFLLEVHEVPMTNRLTRFALDAVRRQGRAGTFRDLPNLAALLARQPEVVGE